MSRTLEVGKLQVSERTADKLLTVHGIHEDQVRAAVEGVGNLPFSWNDDPERGRRAYVVTEIQDRPTLVILYPAVGELGTVWNLGSAYPIDE